MAILMAGLAAPLSSCGGGNAGAQETYTLLVSVSNPAPENGTFWTPLWVGLHDGERFDTYDPGTQASSLPGDGAFPTAMEALCEDGNTQPIVDAFAQLIPSGEGEDTVIVSDNPNQPQFRPGNIAGQSTGSATFTINDPTSLNMRFFSYATMIIPSNDFCIANGNPQAHQLFDTEGNFVGQDFQVLGTETLDAGTELNDEFPTNVAFLEQAEGNTGVAEQGFIGAVGGLVPLFRFYPPPPESSGVILGSERTITDPDSTTVNVNFTNANFLASDYVHLNVSFTCTLTTSGDPCPEP